MFKLFCSISWCDNLVPNKYGTEVYLTCSLHDARDVIIFQVNVNIEVDKKTPKLFFFSPKQTKLGDEKTYIGARAVTQNIDEEV